MKFDTPAKENPIDRGRVIGRPHDRIEGKAKVAGTAPYAYEQHAAAPNPAYGVIVGAGIAIGSVSKIDTKDALAQPGVIAVLTHENAGKHAKPSKDGPALLGGPAVHHYDQALALVIAETFEQARDAAGLVHIDYEIAKGQYDLESQKEHGIKTPDGFLGPSDTAVGDFDGAFARSAVRMDETYTTPDQSHAMMEPHASIAAWDGDKVTLWTSNQMINWAVAGLAKQLMIPPANVRIVSPFIGGGFGAKLSICADALLAALGARLIKRPVKVALARPQIANNTSHRPATIQRIRIGADKDGRIEAIAHDSWSGDLPGGGMLETAANQTRLLYAGAHRRTSHRLATLHLPRGGAMRAPGEAVGMLAIEVAMDELAEKVGIDPIELRIRNDVQYDPEAGPSRPFSSRKLVECLRDGAERFGWSERNATPGSRREGRWLVGMGVASALRNNLALKSGAAVSIDGKGHVTVETDMTDIGTGSYTIIAQTAAEMMGVPMEAVTVRLGDSNFPASSGSGGQWGANSATSGVYAACMALRQQLAQKAGFNAHDELVFEDGAILGKNRKVSLKEAAGDGLRAEDSIEFGDLADRYAQATFGAHFCEVGVDVHSCEVRIRRMSGVFSAGRILNPKTARSQVIGAMVMGAGAALMEELVVDKRFGYFVNRDLAEYHVPVHADIPHQDVIFLDGVDDKSSPMKAMGVGELGICGAGAAVANAVYNACGVRVREFPITLDKILAKMEMA